MKTILAFLLIIALPVQAGWEMQSSDTAAGSAIVWDDHANERTTHPGDAGAFDLWLATDQSGDHAWSLPSHVDGRGNPLHGAFASLTVGVDGYQLGDLAVRGSSTAPVYLEAGEPKTFHVEYRLRPFDEAEARERLAQTSLLYQDQVAARTGEVFGWLSLIQVAAPECPPGDACLRMRQGFHFGLSFRLDATLPVLELTSTSPERLGTDAATGALLYRGSCYASNVEHVVTFASGAGVDVFLDDWTKRQATIPPGARVQATLPAGEHCLLYRTPEHGTVHVRDTRGRFDWDDDLTRQPAFPWAWLVFAIATIVIIGTAWRKAHDTRRQQLRQVCPGQPTRPTSSKCTREHAEVRQM